MMSLIFPFSFGIVVGFIFNNLSVVNQYKAQSAIIGFANIELFNICALSGVIVVSVYVIFKGEITSPLNRTKSIILYGLPTVAFGACVPFFAALSGFLIGSPTKNEKGFLVFLTIIGFIWSAGFLSVLLIPAHSGFYPRNINKKRTFYIIVLISSITATFWHYFA